MLLPKKGSPNHSFLIYPLTKLVFSVMRMFIRESRVVRRDCKCRKTARRNEHEQKKKQKELKKKERLMKELREKVWLGKVVYL